MATKGLVVVGVSKNASVRMKQQKEADAFNSLGMKYQDLVMEYRLTSNPLLREKIKRLMDDWKARSKKSQEQNRLNFQRLDGFKADALGVGLRKVIKSMKKDAVRNHDLESKALYMLLSTEFANLEAKRKSGQVKRYAYERKSFLMEDVEPLLKKLGWKHGVNNANGKNASYLFFVYLPNGKQLTWHSNDFYLSQLYPYIEDEWDGQVCSTMPKLIDYVGSKHTFKKVI